MVARGHATVWDVVLIESGGSAFGAEEPRADPTANSQHEPQREECDGEHSGRGRAESASRSTGCSSAELGSAALSRDTQPHERQERHRLCARYEPTEMASAIHNAQWPFFGLLIGYGSQQLHLFTACAFRKRPDCSALAGWPTDNPEPYRTPHVAQKGSLGLTPSATISQSNLWPRSMTASTMVRSPPNPITPNLMSENQPISRATS